MALTWPDVRRRAIALLLWLPLLWMTAGPPTLPPLVIATATTLQTIAILTLFGLAVRIGRAAADRPTGAAA